MAHYTPLIEVVAQHAYFADQRCRGLRFAATENTRAWLSEVDGLCRDTGSGMVVLADETRLAAAAARPSGLAWTLHADDPLLAAVTEGLPARGTGHWPELMLFRHPALAKPPAPVQPKTDTRADPGQRWQRVRPEVSDFLGADDHRRPPLGLVRLPVPRAPGGGSEALRYTIGFAVRAPIWKYCIVGHWSDDPLEVVSSNGPSSTGRRDSPFGKPKSEVLPDGRPVLAFLSGKGIELRERPERRFALRSATDQRVLLERLPMAGADHFAFESNGEQRQLVSEIYVHR